MLRLKTITLKSFFLSLIYFHSGNGETPKPAYRSVSIGLTFLSPSTECTMGHASYIENLTFDVYINAMKADPNSGWNLYKIGIYFYYSEEDRELILNVSQPDFCNNYPGCSSDLDSMKFKASALTRFTARATDAFIRGEWNTVNNKEVIITYSNRLNVGLLTPYNRHKAIVSYGLNGQETTYPLVHGKRCFFWGRTSNSDSLMKLRFCAYDGPVRQGFSDLHLADCNGKTASAPFGVGWENCVSLDYSWTGQACYVIFSYVSSPSACRKRVDFNCSILPEIEYVKQIQG
ncbi:uncharacterized protein LOC131952260 [Physella acuta]|uniref:uncharacterized protein LOC131952260 n=1 Tax=Physella acuta TaxID=109671 RepID=UPI0027DCE9EA|nr:uncharacterized protein LOC131952260 [Physella acuta]XP_059170830.1 uncharacterized protein LOC131952260 [Physella acuta]